MYDTYDTYDFDRFVQTLERARDMPQISWRRASSLFGGVWVFLVVALIDRRVPLE